MKLLHFIGSIDPKTGGTYEGLMRTCDMMLSLGVQAEVASLDPPGLFNDLADNLTFPCYQIGSDARSYYGKSPRAVAWLDEHVDKYDAVIVHGLWQYHSHAVSCACREHNVPYYIFSHGMLDPWFNQTYPLKRIKKQIYWWLREYTTVKNATSMLFTTEEEKQLARSSFRPYRCNETVVGYGTSGPPEARKELLASFNENPPKWAERPYLIFMSRIQEKKGLDLLLSAYGELRSERTSIPDLVIAGTAHDSEYLLTLQSDFPQQGVHWIGHISGYKKWEALAAAEAMILVSHQENFGIVVAEALSVGTPVLISNKVNIWREISSGKAGLIDDDTLDGARRLLGSWQTLPDQEKEIFPGNCLKTFNTYFDIRQSTQCLLDRVKKDIS